MSVGIPLRVKVVATVSCLSKTAAAVWLVCMHGTKDKVRGQDTVSFGNGIKVPFIGLIKASYGVSIKVACVSLYLYNNDVLPPTATSLACLPAKDSGSISSALA